MLPTAFHIPPDTIARVWRTFTETGRISAEDAIDLLEDRGDLE